MKPEVETRSRQFWVDENGAILPIFAAAVFVALIVAGISVDYGRAFSARTAVQTALDAAVFAAAKASAIDGVSPDEAVKKFFNSTAIKKYGVKISNLKGRKSKDGVFVGSLKGKIRTPFLGIAGASDLDLNIESEVMYGLNNVEVALVLDATKSMAGSKFSTMKTAAKDLVDTLFDVPEADKKVKVAVVPFSNHVNVGMGNRNAPWISVPADYTEIKYSCTTTKPVIDKQGCRTETKTGYSDGVPYTYDREVCDSYTYGPEEETCGDKTSTYKWNGCVGSRNHPLNTQDDSYGTPVPGLLNTWCPSALSPLSKVETSIKSDIDAMTTSGDTYIASGLIWGWRVLSNKSPFDESAKDSDIKKGEEVTKYLVLMTDGANTRSPNYPDNWGSNANLANTLTTETCVNAKKDKIQIFTIAFEVTDTTIKTLLENCASSTVDFYDATNSTQLLAAFASIGESMTQVRLRK